jgi:hypothetical protein
MKYLPRLGTLIVLISAASLTTFALASDRFVDVPDDHVFHDDIAAIADAKVTLGCNPPANDEYCPDGFVTRGQMAAFLNRLGALSPGKEPVVNAAELEGYDSTSFVKIVVATEGCDGIQAAIDGLPDSGGEVIVGAGTYVCDEPVVIARNHVSLRGTGAATMLRLADGANSPLLIVGDTSGTPAVAHHHITVSSMHLEGNSAAQRDECWGGKCSGGFFRPIRNNTLTIRGATDVLVENVVARDARSGGLVTERGCRRISVRGFESYEHVFDGLAAYLTEDSTFTDLLLHDNGAAGLSFDDNFNRNLIEGVVIADSATNGVFMRYSHDNVFSNIQIRDSAEHGIFIAQIDSDTSTGATGNTFHGLLIAESGKDGLHVANASNVDNIVDSVQFVGNAGDCLFEPSPVVLLGETICR